MTAGDKAAAGVIVESDEHKGVAAGAVEAGTHGDDAGETDIL